MFIALAAASAMLLGGCASMRLAYNHAPELVYWKLDSYADFDREQKPRVKAAINQWMQWHRTTQLPDYVSLLSAQRAEVEANVTPAQVCALFDRGRERVQRGWMQVLPSVADIALTLKPAQLDRIEKKYASANEDVRKDYLQETPEERRKASIKRTVANAEKLYGNLGPRQRAVIEAGVAASPRDEDLWFAERQERQRDTITVTRKLLAEHASREQATAAYQRLIAELRHSPDPAYAAHDQKVHQYNCSFWADIHNSTTPAQRKHAAERIERWATDFQLLIDER